ncbi:unnamed protein product, partial [Porites lobata]
RCEVGKSQSILLNIDESGFQFERFELHMLWFNFNLGLKFYFVFFLVMGEKGSPGVKGPKGEKGIPGSCDAKSLSSIKSAFCSAGDIKKTKTSSMIYKIDESTGSFSLCQTLQTRGAYDLEYFSIGNKHFLAFANYYDGTHQLDSTIYQWNGKL